MRRGIQGTQSEFGVSVPMFYRIKGVSYREATDSTECYARYSNALLNAAMFYTVGYGDIIPVSHVARMLAAMEAITGTLYVAVLISRLVALYSSEKLQLGAQKH